VDLRGGGSGGIEGGRVRGEPQCAGWIPVGAAVWNFGCGDRGRRNGGGRGGGGLGISVAALLAGATEGGSFGAGGAGSGLGQGDCGAAAVAA